MFFSFFFFFLCFLLALTPLVSFSCNNRRRLVVSSLHLVSTKLSPFLYILVLASLDAPGGVPVIRGAAARECAVVKRSLLYHLSLVVVVIYLPSTKLPPFLYTLVLASLDTPGGALGDPWSGSPRAPVLRFVPILYLSLSLSLFVVVVWSGARTPSYFYVLVVVVVWSGTRAFLLLCSRRGGGLKWSARAFLLLRSRRGGGLKRSAPWYAFVQFRVM